ncbi:thiamine phosphate synthase [Nocardioides ferulae]|uniref:thiamine phosphate synthase n=1 Tax=Nocardioides ferulae TaxID=2340821 RepID=UPI000EAF8171|nr:thiamine phosphate synthase [Nocardioides ferulae]
MTALPRVLVLTDRTLVPAGRGLESVLASCADAGITHVVLRELDLDDARRATLALRLAPLGLTVLAARRPLPGCPGVHLAAGQPRPDGASGLAWGRSCHSRSEVGQAAAQGASWATLSPYARTPSKPGYGPPLPSGALAGHRLPVFALGGIGPENAAAARRAGAHGVAVMGSLMRADDPAATAAALLRAVTA